MIISVEEAKKYIKQEIEDSVLEAKLSALESLIRKKTNNDFAKQNIRVHVDVYDGVLIADVALPFKAGDTVQISGSKFNDGLYTIEEISDETVCTVKEETIHEDYVLATKVVYPLDVVQGVINMLKWDLENRDKVGVQSETISRHSVTYFSMDGDNSSMGYPKSLIGFLKPYMRARF